MLYYTILHYTILYCAILYYTIPYHTILLHNIIRSYITYYHFRQVVALQGWLLIRGRKWVYQAEAYERTGFPGTLVLRFRKTRKRNK